MSSSFLAIIGTLNVTKAFHFPPAFLLMVHVRGFPSLGRYL